MPNFTPRAVSKIAQATKESANRVRGGGLPPRARPAQSWQVGMQHAHCATAIAAGATGTVEFYTDADSATLSGRTATVKNICGAATPTTAVLFVNQFGGKLAIVGWVCP